MRIVVFGHGTTGDVAPMMSLAEGLWTLGHDVQLLAPEDFSPAAAKLKVPYVSTAVNSEKSMRNPQVHRLLSAVEKKHFWKMGALLPILKNHKRATETALACLRGLVTDDDVLIYPLTARVLAGLVCAEKGARHLGVHFAPMHTTENFPHALTSQPGWGARYNRTTHAVGHFIAQRAFFSRVNALKRRMRIHLKDSRVLTQIASHATRSVCLWSPHLLPAPDDWPGHVDVLGYPAPNAANWEPPQDLVDFLNAGPRRPVYVGFGSVPSANPGQMYKVVRQALRMSGERGIIYRGWGGLEGVADSDDVFICDHVPHHWLFPRVAAIAHHCGCGTTHSAARSGRPSIPVPVAVDQPFWGHRLYSAGVATKPLPRGRLRARQLAAAISKAVHDESMHEAALHLKLQMCEEQPIAALSQILQQEFDSPSGANRRRLQQSTPSR